MNIGAAEQQKYTGIFQSQNPVNGKVSGQQAKAVFMQSGLALPQLGQIWNLCDIDKDGQMDVEEFVLAMHFIFSVLNGSLPTIPTTLPPHLIPPSKRQFTSPQPVTPNNNNHSMPLSRPPQLPPTNRGFDWHINSSDKANYESIFNRFCRPGSSTADLSTLKGFLLDKGFSPTDLNQAWNLVDVKKIQALERDQFTLLLHILDSHRKGIAFPSNIPIHLSNRFLGLTPPPPTPSMSMPRPVSNYTPPVSNYTPPVSNYTPPVSNYAPPTSNYTPPVSSHTPPVSVPTHTPSPTHSTQSWASEPPKPQVDQAAIQEARDKEKRLREELADLDRKLASPPSDTSMTHKTKEELESLLFFLQKLDRALPKSSSQSGGDEGGEMLKDLEFLAKSIKGKHSELTSMVALQKRELEELQLAINKKKYGV